MRSVKDLREMATDQIEFALHELRGELGRGCVVNDAGNPYLRQTRRREIARMLTVLAERSDKMRAAVQASL